MLAHVLTLVVNCLTGLGWVVGLVMYFLNSQKSPFVAFHALQASLFQLAVSLIGAACLLLWFLLLPLCLLLPLAIAGIVYPIIGAINANEGGKWEYPIVGSFCRKAANP